MPAGDTRQLMSLLDELRKAVGELLFAGLTAASKATIERLDVSFKEASRMKLLRLGSTLRIANEEISRFTASSPQFSARRLVFFLGRAWLLATAMRKAIEEKDTEGLNRLQHVAGSQPVEKLNLVTVGVGKRVVNGAFASFDFRMRAVGAAGIVADREALVWSCVFPLRKDLDLPAEAFLHLPQKQKFKPCILVEKKVVEVSKCAVSKQPGGATRLVLGEASEVKAGEAFGDWASMLSWDVKEAAARLERYRPTPMDLEIEFQEEVFLPKWEPAEQKAEEGYDALVIEAEHLPFEVRLDKGPSGVPLREVMKKMAAKKNRKRPPIYGRVHYEACRLILQPLSVLGEGGIEYVTVSQDKISQAELVRAMKFT